MLQIDNFVYASSLEHAYDILISTPGSVILGGCGYLKLGDRTLGTAIDLSKLKLDYITETAATIEVGAMTSFRALETGTLTGSLWNGVLRSALENIVGVQFRATVTVGGTISGRYPFSDLITALLALDAELYFHNRGLVKLNNFLHGKPAKDILEKIILPKDRRRAAYSSIRKTRTDYAVLNCAVAQIDESYRIVVGSRPGRAARTESAEQHLNNHGLNDKTISEAGRLAANSLKFGGNPRGSSLYRQSVCPVLVRRALQEVLHAA